MICVVNLIDAHAATVACNPAGKANTAPVSSPTVAAGAALALLQREAAVQQLQALLGVVRARDAFAAAGPARLRAYYLTGGWH